MRLPVVVAALLAHPLAAGADALDGPRNEIGLGGFATIATRGTDSAAGIRVLGGRTWNAIGLRFEYAIVGVGVDDIHRYGYMHRGGATVRLRRAWYRERRGRFDGFLDLGAGRQAIHWRDGATDWRNDIALGIGTRFDGIRDDGGFIGYGLGITVIVAPSIAQPNAARMLAPRDSARDVAVFFGFEAVL